jgi:uncharacterized protein (UPF0335 family)
MTMGHNSVAADQLRLFIERVERLEEEKKSLSDDIREVYAEAKANGYDAKIMRECVRLRKMETHLRQERDALLETYRAALGIDFSDTPLGQAALDSATAEFGAHLSKMDEQGIGVSIGAGDGTMTPLNRTAAEQTEQTNG